MRELAFEERRCGACGAGLPESGGADVYAEGGGASFFSVPGGAPARCAPRVRSGLAYAAGYAGVAYLYLYTLTPLVFRVPGTTRLAGLVLVMLWRLWAPAALVLAYAAGLALDRSPEKSGRLPALFGLLVGLYGTFYAARAAVGLLRYLNDYYWHLR